MSELLLTQTEDLFAEHPNLTKQVSAKKLAFDAIDNSNLVPPEMKASPGEDFFSKVGYRLLCVDMLLETVKTIRSAPNSIEAQIERDWLMGVRNPEFSPGMCFEAVGGDGVDPEVAQNVFVKALAENPEMLESSLRIAYSKIENREFDYAVDDFFEATVRHSVTSSPRPLG